MMRLEQQMQEFEREQQALAARASQEREALMTRIKAVRTKLRTLGVNPLSLLRVINVKFLLQPHQKCYITQCEELGF